MFAITGITGNIGGQVARTLLASHLPVRAIVRDQGKAQTWSAQACEIAQADIFDSNALSVAFRGAEAVFILIPPYFDPAPGFPEAHSIAVALKSAIESAHPNRVVYLSTIGAQATEPNLLTQHSIIEKALRNLPTPITYLRPGWFMENASWDVAPARDSGIIPGFLQPLDKPVPMVATADIARVASQLLQESWQGHRVVELEGSHRITPNQIAATFSELLHRPVQIEAVPRDSWEQLFRAQGMKNPTPRIRMLDGFNQGWIEFEAGPSGSLKGAVELRTVLETLLQSPSASQA